MWLINTSTFNLELVPSHGVGEWDDDPSSRVRPPYAILSHRWRDGEVLFQDMPDHSKRQLRQGWTKIVNCCRKAREDKLQYVWIDTCCINKDSATELSEAINSMYRWYHDAEICYLYADDIGEPFTKEFGQAEVWSRSWCLQELIAPRHLLCLDHDWNTIGSRAALQDEIFNCTGVDRKILAGTLSLDTFTIAQRMSWAARRRTMKPEDRAYSLIGIFGVSLPLMYGEGGERSFMRLQIEIIKDFDDDTIFAWGGTNFPRYSSLLAPSPSAFAECGQVRSYISRDKQSPVEITNRGIAVTFQMKPWTIDTYVAKLRCTRDRKDETSTEPSGPLCIFLRRLKEDDLYCRVAAENNSSSTGTYASANNAIVAAADYPGINAYRMSDNAVAVIAGNRCQFSARRVVVPRFKRQLVQMESYKPKIYGFRLSKSLLDLCTTSNGQPLGLGHDAHFDESERLVSRDNGADLGYPFFTIDITGLGTAIRLLRVFLDVDFNPVCFLGTFEATEEDNRYHLEEDGITVKAVPIGGFPEVHNEYQKSFWDRHPGDKYGWNNVLKMHVDDVPFQSVSKSVFRDGLWQIRGDREHGLYAQLRGMRSVDGTVNTLEVRVSREHVVEGDVWEVDVRPSRWDVMESILMGLKRTPGLKRKPKPWNVAEFEVNTTEDDTTDDGVTEGDVEEKTMTEEHTTEEHIMEEDLVISAQGARNNLEGAK